MTRVVDLEPGNTMSGGYPGTRVPRANTNCNIGLLLFNMFMLSHLMFSNKKAEGLCDSLPTLGILAF